jgi:ubiquinone/menaquinone biosynthesis C-methylase UbiE
MAKFIPALRYDWLTPYFDVIIRRTMPESRFRRALVRQADIQPQQQVLDFGAGTASLSLLAKQLAPESAITGVDIDERISAIARRKVDRAGAAIRIDTYDGTTLPYADDSFDKVISSLVFHHLTRAHKKRALAEIRRVLKPGGELHVADWGKARSVAGRILYLIVQVFDGFETTTDNVNGMLPALIEEAGFVDVEETRTFATVYGTLSLYCATHSSRA